MSKPELRADGHSVIRENGSVYAVADTPAVAKEIAGLKSDKAELVAALRSFDDAFGHYCEGDPSDDEIVALQQARALITKHSKP